MGWSKTTSLTKVFLPVANGTHFNGGGGSAAAGNLPQVRRRATRKLLRVIAGGADTLQVEWANIWTTNTPSLAVNSSCELAGPNSVTCRMAIEYPAGNPRQVSGSTAYSATTAYALLDQVTSGGSKWVCIQAGTGQTPAVGSAYWRKVNTYTVGWSNQTDTYGTVVFAPGDYRRSNPIPLLEMTRQGDLIAVLGEFDTGSTSNYVPYAGANGASNTAPFVDWVLDSTTALPAGSAGTAFTETGVTTQTNGNTTTAANTNASTWMKIPYATAITGNIPVRRCVALFGDSLMAGYGGDIRDGEPCGVFPRSIDGTSWWRIAQGGNRAGCYQNLSAPWQMSVVGRCTAVVTNLAMNDINANLTLAQTQSAMQAVWQALARTGVPVYTGMLTPISASTDAWATTTNQSRYTNGGVVATTQNPTDDASFLTSVYGQISMWISQDGASIADVGGATIRVGQAGHPLEGILDWRDLLMDPATSWKWPANMTTDGAHPTATAVQLQVPFAMRRIEPVIMGRQQIPMRVPGNSPHGEALLQSFPRSMARDLSTVPATGSAMGVVDVSPGGWYYGIRAWAGTAVGSRSWSVLVGADANKLKCIASGTATSVANSLFDNSLSGGSPVWVPAGYLVVGVLTAPAASSWVGQLVETNAALLHKTGMGHAMAGASADTAALTVGTTYSLFNAAKFTAGRFRPWFEFY